MTAKGGRKLKHQYLKDECGKRKNPEEEEKEEYEWTVQIRLKINQIFQKSEGVG